MAKIKRRVKLIKPELQLRLTLTFVALSGLALLMQVVLLAQRLTYLASYMPQDGAYVIDQLPSILGGILLISFGMLLPLTVTVGVLVTFKIAGPLYRFEMFLKSVRDGNEVKECRIRRGDHLQDFCVLLNEVTAPLRARNAERLGASGEEPVEQAA